MLELEIIMINHCSSTPLYIQLKDLLENEIHNGTYSIGEKLPSEQELCRKYDVSRITVRQALKILEQKQLIYAVHGKGTFVKFSEIDQSLPRILSFSETLSNKGLNGYTKIHSFDMNSDNENARDILSYAKHICNLNLIGYAQNTPVVFYRSFMDIELGEKMHEVAIDMQKNSMAFSTYDFYSRIGVELGRVKQNITAVNMNKDIAQIFQLPLGQALMVLKSTYYNKNGDPIECKLGYYRADIFAFNLERQL